MKKTDGKRYNSLWDGSTWGILGLIAVCCIVPCFMDDGIWPTIISLAILLIVLVMFIGIYYRIDGDKLVVYTFFHPKAYPICKIKEIKPTKSTISSPATSFSHRLAITFTDPNILNSTTPLIISPADQEDFVRRLLSVNAKIQYSAE